MKNRLLKLAAEFLSQDARFFSFHLKQKCITARQLRCSTRSFYLLALCLWAGEDIKRLEKVCNYAQVDLKRLVEVLKTPWLLAAESSSAADNQGEKFRKKKWK